MATWKVKYDSQVEKQMRQDFASGKLTREDVTLIKTWVREIEEYGPQHIQIRKIWDDHPLEKEWAGYRSSCFSLRGRIIYRIENDKIIVQVVRITLDHDYKKGGRS